MWPELLLSTKLVSTRRQQRRRVVRQDLREHQPIEHRGPRPAKPLSARGIVAFLSTFLAPMAARPPLPRHVPRQLLVLCWVAGAAARGCQLWTSTICQYLEGFDVSDPLTVESTCKGLCTRHRGCDGLCKCVAANYESTCECSIGECAAQRPAMICNQGCPYWEDSCYDLCNCLVEKEGELPASRLPRASGVD
jgi:hypothetical protein